MTSKDTTFLSFTPEQAAQYARGRGGSYPESLYQAIFDYHAGDAGLVYDIGTGPGKVVVDLLPRFRYAYGCDTSPQMIEQAKRDSDESQTSKRTHFMVAGDVNCADALPTEAVGQVDVMTVAMAAHWFSLPEFYAQAAKALKPGGTLAMWTCSELFCHPSEPNHEKIQEILYGLERGMLKPHDTPGNILSRNAYEGIGLPWTLSPAISGFDEASFTRRDWDRHGVPSAAPLADGTPGPFLFGEVETLDHLEKGLAAASMVVRWRKANPEKAGTEQDAVRMTIARLREALGGRESFNCAPSSSLLLMRKR
ncbi:S-adenosyl-L-methionine-dependent methyltransferase [Polychaeton citri CBS 116435]|uniref:S-adenosyl-L-methionine-dependent methyltransferase n=1 Tax=Polychaeton citri CBS 116435 TaxID=1314669 RepID=A0A9P4QC43_9PEZI|nr:S-adenosyl-L-methionine-dependent methyltransferase [Polychaeton citri CBS 116435]